MLKGLKAGLASVAVCGLVIGVVVVPGCTSVGYYRQAISGHLSMMIKREPVAELLADPDLPAALRHKLELTREVLAFAEGLGLPVDGSYSSYVATGKQFLVWNVMASPEFSLTPELFCYPIAGCVSYRGYFAREAAEGVADQLRATGFDVYMGGVTAYSTLGWFDDPLLDTFLARDDVYLAALLFHELAHKAVYVQSDSVFNESLATTVETEAMGVWLEDRGEAAAFTAFVDEQRRRDEVVGLVNETRAQLAEVYRADLPVEAMRDRKQAVIRSLRSAYSELRAGWGGPEPYRVWVEGEINNAKLGTISTYHSHVPAFRQTYREAGSMAAFLARCRELAAMSEADRTAALATAAPGA